MVLVVEGLCYALFPKNMIQFMRQMIDTPPEAMRRAGVVAVAIGVFLVWIIRHGGTHVAGGRDNLSSGQVEWFPIVFRYFDDGAQLNRGIIE